MARPNPIRAIMATPLPGITYQRRKQFRPTDAEVDYAYDIINKYVFDGVLKKPVIKLKTIHKAWGMCHWMFTEQQRGTHCKIDLMDKWFCPQWFMNTLAHEMVHQYQWDVYRWQHLETHGRPMFEGSNAHGPSFFMFRERFDYYDLTLKTWFGQKRWFRHQVFTKC